MRAIRKWKDLCNIVHDPDVIVPALQRLYKSPRDIDLYLGVLLEKQPRPLGFRRRNPGFRGRNPGISEERRRRER